MAVGQWPHPFEVIEKGAVITNCLYRIYKVFYISWIIYLCKLLCWRRLVAPLFGWPQFADDMSDLQPNFATPRSLKCNRSVLKSALTTVWVKMCTLLYLFISSAIRMLTSSILLFSCGLSWRWGIWHIMTVFPRLFRDMLSMTFFTSLTQFGTEWFSMSLPPADTTLISLVGICFKHPLIR